MRALVDMTDEEVLKLALDYRLADLFGPGNPLADGREYFERLNIITDKMHEGDRYWPAPVEGNR